MEAKQEKRIPRFSRQNRRLKRIGAAWRKPRGIDNKQRVQRKGFGELPKIGYRQTASQRGLHPSGMREVRVSNLSELEKAGKNFAVRFSGQVGGRKKKIMREHAKKMGFKVLN